MPTYEYECSLCHSRFERKQRFDEEPVSICPQCQGKAHRILHSVPVFFRGSGFYSTDHNQGSPSNKKEQPPTEKEGKEGSSKE
jgi:putative FmdB family regulatory protein